MHYLGQSRAFLSIETERSLQSLVFLVSLLSKFCTHFFLLEPAHLIQSHAIMASQAKHLIPQTGFHPPGSAFRPSAWGFSPPVGCPCTPALLCAAEAERPLYGAASRGCANPLPPRAAQYAVHGGAGEQQCQINKGFVDCWARPLRIFVSLRSCRPLEQYECPTPLQMLGMVLGMLFGGRILQDSRD